MSLFLFLLEFCFFIFLTLLLINFPLKLFISLFLLFKVLLLLIFFGTLNLFLTLSSLLKAFLFEDFSKIYSVSRNLWILTVLLEDKLFNILLSSFLNKVVFFFGFPVHFIFGENLGVILSFWVTVFQTEVTFFSCFEIYFLFCYLFFLVYL